MKDLESLKKLMTDFRDARGWQKHHNPKDVAQALSIEASELLEHFLWVSQEDSYKQVEKNREAIADEMADVFAYLLSLSDVTGIHLGEALERKMLKNAQKYPLEKFKRS